MVQEQVQALVRWANAHGVAIVPSRRTRGDEEVSLGWRIDDRGTTAADAKSMSS